MAESIGFSKAIRYQALAGQILDTWYAVTLVAVPGNEGHLFYADGINGYSTNYLYFSSDGGATIFHVSPANITYAGEVALGKAKPGNSYPSIFLYGTCNSDTSPGLYRCDNFNPSNPIATVTWTLLSDMTNVSLDFPWSISGDLDTYGTVYVGYSASGYAWGHL